MYPVEHYIFHRGFETNTDWGPRTVGEFKQFVKIAALFYRGIVVSDSDFNNKPIFFELTKDKNIKMLQEALQTGMLRRAARLNQNDGVSITQQAVFESFKRNSHKLAAYIPDEHPKKLDKILDPIENEHEPLIWAVDQLTTVFGRRLTIELKEASLSSEGRYLADKIIEYVNNLGEGYPGLRAATVEHDILPRWRESESQRHVFAVVLRAYNGNVPSAFKGNLMVGDPIGGDKSIIPGGPESNYNEQEFAVKYYAALISNKTEELFACGEEQITTSHVNWYLDTKKLRKLNLDQIVELRENAAPKKYFNLRSQALGSPKKLATKFIDLYEAKNAYWESLADAGVALNRSAEEKGRKEARLIYLAKRCEDEKIQIQEEKFKILGEIFGGGVYVASISAYDIWERTKDLNQAKSGEGHLTEKSFAEADLIYNISLKRPDYRVIDKLHREITSGKYNEKQNP